ncbi:kinesin light chain [Fusarium denticulatum]|uniref:Kinesin light chain n=1 Tax=Fusarium denticulatum TaxID=48507 RepID=A0A8H5TIX5_9HYPO|nr:kinesin light chain [Fusarium denticulatum]
MDPPDPGHVNGRVSQPSETVRVDSALPKNGRTFRAHGVPLEWDTNRLESFLADHEGSVGPIVRSLATEIHGRSQSATVTFQNLSHDLQAVHAGQTRSVLLPKSSSDQPARPQYLVLDHDFFGITTVFIPPLDDHKVDVIAISGLGGHAFGSFKERGGDYMWLRDSLPHDVVDKDTDNPIARVMIYGYESSVANSNSFQNIEDLATSFHSSLRILADSPTTRPVILVAHSLGGLIVKQTLISLSKSKHEDDKRLIRAVYGIMFFGVPHDGLDISSLIPMVGDRPNRFLIESISHVNSQILSMQQRAFYTALGEESDSEIVCFYETEKSPTARKDENGDWSMLGPKTCLVTKSSATHCRSWEDGPEHICAIARTHSVMVKFEPHDYEYDIVCTRLKGLARRALTARRHVQSSDARFLVPYVQNHNFVGRHEILESLKLQLGYGLHQKPVKPRSRVSLFGLGGVGKTQVALAYVYWLRQMCPDISVFWVHASNRERFRQSYASIAEECDIPGQDDPKVDVLVLVKDWLEKRFKSRWLMVIDNADDTQLFSHPQNIQDSIKASVSATGADGGLGRYVPECAHGSVLTTSRDKQTALRLSQSKRSIEINKMTDGEADLLMRTILEDDGISIEETSLLTTRLEHLPLALAQAAAFIQENTISISRYIQLLDESDVALLDRLSEPFETVGRDSDTPHAVTATWIISFEQIEKQDRFTGEVLSLVSLLDRQAIPREFIVYYWQRNRVSEVSRSSQEARVTKALGTLKAFCFISEAKDESLDMHRLVQVVARKWLTIKGKMAEFAQQALRTVSSAFPYGEFETREVCLKYLPHAFAVLKDADTASKAGKRARARLLHNMAGYYLYEARWKEAEEYQVAAVELRRDVLREENPDTLASMGNLALTYSNQGRWKEAEELQVDVMEIRKRVLGEEHPNTLTCMGNLALTYSDQGRWKEGEELEVKVLEIRKRVLGEEHPDTLASMANLALIYRKQGSFDAALTLMKECVFLRKSVLGTDHPDAVLSMTTLARWQE